MPADLLLWGKNAATRVVALLSLVLAEKRGDEYPPLHGLCCGTG